MKTIINIVRTLLAIACILYLIAVAIGGLTLIAVAEGLYVQTWWQPFAQLFVTSCHVFGVALIVAAVIAVTYVIARIFQWDAVADVIEFVAGIFVSLMSFVGDAI